MRKRYTETELMRLTEGGKKEWNLLNSETNLEEFNRPHMFQCLKCKSQSYQDSCSNCGNTSIKIFGGFNHYPLQVFCSRCDHHYTDWTCSNCGCKNSNIDTIYSLEVVKQGSCFVATATFQSSFAPEVITLRKYRDEVLLNSALGRAIIRIYYYLSPSIASAISSSTLLRTISRKLLTRLVLILQKEFKR